MKGVVGIYYDCTDIFISSWLILIVIPNQLGLFKIKALITSKQMYLFRNTVFRSVTAVTEIKIYFKITKEVSSSAVFIKLKQGAQVFWDTTPCRGGGGGYFLMNFRRNVLQNSRVN
jgi:hypothetical protein